MSAESAGDCCRRPGWYRKYPANGGHQSSRPGTFSLLMGQLAYEGGKGPEIAYRFECFD